MCILRFSPIHWNFLVITALRTASAFAALEAGILGVDRVGGLLPFLGQRRIAFA
jgi:hypothetical protein